MSDWNSIVRLFINGFVGLSVPPRWSKASKLKAQAEIGSAWVFWGSFRPPGWVLATVLPKFCQQKLLTTFFSQTVTTFFQFDRFSPSFKRLILSIPTMSWSTLAQLKVKQNFFWLVELGWSFVSYKKSKTDFLHAESNIRRTSAVTYQNGRQDSCWT